MFEKVIGKACKNTECPEYGKVVDASAVMCECGQDVSDVVATDKTKLTITVLILVLGMIAGGYVVLKKSQEDPKMSMINVSKGLEMARNKNIEEAEKYFAEAAKNNSKNDQAWGNWGAALITNKRPKDAIEKLQQAIKLNPGQFMWHLNLAEAYSLDDNKVDAFKELEEAEKAGFKDFSNIVKFDFTNIQEDPRYKKYRKEMPP